MLKLKYVSYENCLDGVMDSVLALRVRVQLC